MKKVAEKLGIYIFFLILLTIYTPDVSSHPPARGKKKNPEPFGSGFLLGGVLLTLRRVAGVLLTPQVPPLSASKGTQNGFFLRP
jgi:hypothetical protein